VSSLQIVHPSFTSALDTAPKRPVTKACYKGLLQRRLTADKLGPLRALQTEKIEVGNSSKSRVGGLKECGMVCSQMVAHLVPEVVAAVAAGRDERAVHRVEGDGVDGVDVLPVPVALERKVLALQMPFGNSKADGGLFKLDGRKHTCYHPCPPSCSFACPSASIQK